MNNEPDYDNLYFEEKKMHTPQVGDVFQSNEDKDVRLHITGKNNVGFEAIVSDKKEVWDIDSWYFDEKYYTYLGKSKANIDDLFEVQDE